MEKKLWKKDAFRSRVVDKIRQLSCPVYSSLQALPIRHAAQSIEPCDECAGRNGYAV